MILRPTLLAAALMTGACATMPAPALTTAETGCDLVAGFTSIGTGIDRDALQRVDALLASDKAVLAVSREPWGREGELSLCVGVKSEAETARLFDAIKARFPASSEKPLTVETRYGQKYRVPTP
jgi:hypothetical protein